MQVPRCIYKQKTSKFGYKLCNCNGSALVVVNT
jgi:hypothetical protein